MKASDKVFVHTGRLGFLCASKINITGNDSEYIRKDALLGILNELIKDCGDSNSFVLGLTSLAYQDVIDKIESL